MPDTQVLYGQSDEAAAQLAFIETRRQRAYDAIEVIARRLEFEVGCTPRDTECLMNHVHDGLADMLDDLVTKWEGERADADEAIGNIEERDLMLSRPVVL